MHNLDAKSLQVFATLLKECNLTRASHTLNMTQSAVSHTLNRLREVFQDPLFVPVGRGMVPTPRALELADPLQRTLDAMDVLVRPAEMFDAAKYEGIFRIATTDYIGFILLPVLVRRLNELAPKVQLVIRPLKPSDDLESLKSGDIDLILWNEETAPPNFYVRKLFSDRLKAIVRSGHPTINGSMSLQQFRAGKHLRISNQHGGAKESPEGWVEKSSEECKASVTVPHFLLAYRLVAESDLIGTIAELTANRISKELRLQVLDSPLGERTFTVSQVWHQRRHTDPAHRWLRGEIVNAANVILCEQSGDGAAAPTESGERGLGQLPR